VGFDGFNDPRLYTIEARSMKYFMVNNEPDCNSIFSLYDVEKEENYEYDDDGVEVIHSVGAVNECDNANWKFIVPKKSSLDSRVIISFCFTAVVAMNVRYFVEY